MVDESKIKQLAEFLRENEDIFKELQREVTHVITNAYVFEFEEIVNGPYENIKKAIYQNKNEYHCVRNSISWWFERHKYSSDIKVVDFIYEIIEIWRKIELSYVSQCWSYRKAHIFLGGVFYFVGENGLAKNALRYRVIEGQLLKVIKLDKIMNLKGEYLKFFISNFNRADTFRVTEDDLSNLLKYSNELGDESLIDEFVNMVENNLTLTEVLQRAIQIDREYNQKGEFVRKFLKLKDYDYKDTVSLLLEYEREMGYEDNSLVMLLIQKTLERQNTNELQRALVDIIMSVIEYDKLNEFNGETVLRLIDNLTIKPEIYTFERALSIASTFYGVLSRVLDYQNVNIKETTKLLHLARKQLISNLSKYIGDDKWNVAFYSSTLEFREPSLSEITNFFNNLPDSYYYNENVVKLIHSIINSGGRFLIFSGPPGTGKTAMAILYAGAYLGVPIAKEFDSIKELLHYIQNSPVFKERAVLVRVRPEWTNPRDIIGYRDIEGTFRKGVIYDLLEKASENPQNLYFVILDEMNLSHPEHYLSDIISAMESKGYLVTENGELKYHNNIVIIGTVNTDETTQNLSPRLLSRSYNITFRTDWDIVKKHEDDMGIKVAEKLEKIDRLLSKIGYGFGYREVIMAKGIIEELGDFNKALDYFLLNKLIPKIKGTEEIKEIVENILEFVRSWGYKQTEKELIRKLDELTRRGFIV